MHRKTGIVAMLEKWVTPERLFTGGDIHICVLCIVFHPKKPCRYSENSLYLFALGEGEITTCVEHDSFERLQSI